MDINITNNTGSSRFEAHVDDYVAVVEYILPPGENKITFTHTEVPEQLEGRGIASALAKYVLQYARDQKLKVVPFCPFISGYIRKHKTDYLDLLDESYQGI